MVRCFAEELADGLHSMAYDFCVQQGSRPPLADELTISLFLEIHWLLRDLNRTLQCLDVIPPLVLVHRDGSTTVNPAFFQVAGDYVYSAYLRLFMLALRAGGGQYDRARRGTLSMLIRLLSAVQAPIELSEPTISMLNLVHVASQYALDIFLYLADPPSAAVISTAVLPGTRSD